MKDSKWLETMVKKHGSEDKVREFMRGVSKKSARNTSGRGGWTHMAKNNPDRLRELSSKGGAKSRRTK